MPVSFSGASFKRLVNLIKKTQDEGKTFPGYFGDGAGTPHLLLVGDQGVYLMSGASEVNQQKGFEDRVIYADLLDPSQQDFNDWWDRKRSEFGSDDGAVALPIDALVRVINRTQRPTMLVVNCTPEYVEFFAK
jgi:hypothetical protein